MCVNFKIELGGATAHGIWMGLGGSLDTCARRRGCIVWCHLGENRRTRESVLLTVAVGGLVYYYCCTII